MTNSLIQRKSIEVNAMEMSDGEFMPVVYVVTYQFNTVDSGWTPMMEIYQTRELAESKVERHNRLDDLYRDVKISNRIVWNF